MKMYPSSPCWLKSSPWISCVAATRRPIVASRIFSRTNVTTAAKTQVTSDGDELADEHADVAVDQPERLAVADQSHVGCAGGEDAGQNRAQRAADAVNAERVERVVVAERRLELGAGEEADEPAAAPIANGRHRIAQSQPPA